MLAATRTSSALPRWPSGPAPYICTEFLLNVAALSSDELGSSVMNTSPRLSAFAPMTVGLCSIQRVSSCSTTGLCSGWDSTRSLRLRRDNRRLNTVAPPGLENIGRLAVTGPIRGERRQRPPSVTHCMRRTTKRGLCARAAHAPANLARREGRVKANRHSEVRRGLSPLFGKEFAGVAGELVPAAIAAEVISLAVVRVARGLVIAHHVHAGQVGVGLAHGALGVLPVLHSRPERRGGGRGRVELATAAT